MTAVFHRRPGFDYPVAIKAQGVRITDAAGKQYIDGVSGAVVCNLGYGDRDIIGAVTRQMEKLAYIHSSSFTTEAVEALAAKLVGYHPDHFGSVFLVSGGSEATETALKLARQHAIATKQPQRTKFISRRNSYHGNSLGALGVSGNPGRRRIYEPLMRSSIQVSPCYAFRDKPDGQTVQDYVTALLEELRRTIEAEGPENILAFIAEPVVGASLGAAPAEAGYFEGVRALCDRYGILLILDEVMCGMGRTGRMFAFEQEGVKPDLTILAKGLGAGYQPIGAVIASNAVYGAVKHGGFEHGHTYMCHASAAAAALAVLQKIESADLLTQVRDNGKLLAGLLRERLRDAPFIGDIRGRGLMLAVEFVANLTTKAPPDPDMQISARLKQATMDAGLICYPFGGFIDGVNGEHVLLAPPFIATAADLAEIVDKFAAAVTHVFAGR